MDRDAFNTKNSALWTKLKRKFSQEIKDRYVQLRRQRNINGEIHPAIFSAENVMKYLDGEVMSKIGQRYYNEDAERKYINDAGSQWLISCNGTRKEFTRRWLEERFVYLDSVYEQGEFNSKTMVLRTHVLGKIKIYLKTYSPQWVRINYTSSMSKKIYVSKDRFYEFEVDMTNDTENDFTLYGANNIMYVNGMENLNVSHISISGAEKLIEVDCSGSEHIKGLALGTNKYLQRVICNDCKRLGEDEKDRTLDLSGCQNLKELNCSNTKISTVNLPTTGGVIEVLNCENTGLTTFTMEGQEYLEELLLSSCYDLDSLTLKNCNGLKRVNMPNTKLSSCTVEGCENITEIDISNTKHLRTLNLQGCPNLVKLNLSGVLSTILTDLDLTSSLKLEDLNISSMPYINTITFGQYRDEEGNLRNYNSLKKFNCSNSAIKAIRYGKTNPIPNYLDLEGLSLDTVNFDSCANLREVRNLNLVASGSSSPFKNCVNLETLQGNLSLRDSISSAFYRCAKLSNIHNTLNLDLTNVTSMNETFYGCSSFTWDEVKFILSKVSNKLTSLGWRTFASCGNIVGEVPQDLFAECTNVNSIYELFAGNTGIEGELPSGLFSGMTKLNNCREAFRGTSISGALPNDLFRPCGSSLTSTLSMFANTKIETFDMENLFKWNTNINNVSGMFSGCSSLAVELDGNLFKNKSNLSDVNSFFNGCSGVYGEIPRELFRTTPNVKNVRYFLRGTNVYGDIPAYVSDSDKGIFDNMPLLEDVTYFFPTTITGTIPENIFKYNPRLSKASGLFNGCTSITGTIPSKLFANNPNISLADRLFKNCTGIDSEIPKGIFDNCTLLTDVAEMFYGCTGLRGQIPERISEWIEQPSEEDPEIMEEIEIIHEYGLFDNCRVLSTANGLFANCTNLHSTIPETLFISGSNITDLSNIFYKCFELYGQIPEGLFKNCRKLIKLDSAFTDCCKLGKTSLEVTEDDPYAMPPKLFSSCINLSSVNNMFSMWGDKPYATTLRGELPKTLFRTNSKLASANTMFAGCNLITGALDGDFFIGNPNIQNCESMFWGTQFTSIGTNILKTNTKIDNIKTMFKGNNKVTGNAPKLWETPATQTAECFNGCTFDDQDAIPPTYK